MNILILSPYCPYPPYGGGTMRIYQIIRGLAPRHTVTCLTFAPGGAGEALAPLREHCRVLTVPEPPPRGPLRRALTTLASPRPDMALRNASAAYQAALRALLATERFDVIQAESIEMARYLTTDEVRGRARQGRPLLVLDQFNAEYVLQKRAAITSLKNALKIAGPRSTAHNLAGGLYSLAQWLKLARYEREVMRAIDAVVAVSEEDVRSLRRLDGRTTIAVVPNGVDAAHFSRAALRPEGAALPPVAGPTLVFSGTLDFRPNVDALAWFAREVLPLVRARRPDARLIAVGRRPAHALRQLADAGALELTGEVPDARPFIAGAAVYIVPMRIGGGVRLKLLEALALEAPVVSTRMGAEGVAGLRGEEHCLLADDPATFAAATLRLVEDAALGRRLGAAGRALVAASYDWGVVIPRLEALYERALKGRGPAS